jgi:hypothetical protein
MSWDQKFNALFDRCLNEYRKGNHDFESYYQSEDLAFLTSIGYRPRELFDFVEDLADVGSPAQSTALLIAAVRRDYFHVVQQGEASEKELARDSLPTFGDTLEGIAYLPRIIAKARAKLKGELHPDIMYSCGGDLKFLQQNNLHAADFLRNVWAAGEDDKKIANYVKSSTA